MSTSSEGSDDLNDSPVRILVSDLYATLTFPGFYSGSVNGDGRVVLSKEDHSILDKLLQKPINRKNLGFSLHIEQGDNNLTVTVSITTLDQNTVTTHHVAKD